MPITFLGCSFLIGIIILQILSHNLTDPTQYHIQRYDNYQTFASSMCFRQVSVILIVRVILQCSSVQCIALQCNSVQYRTVQCFQDTPTPFTQDTPTPFTQDTPTPFTQDTLTHSSFSKGYLKKTNFNYGILLQ